MNELQVMIRQQDGVIDFNYEEIKQRVADEMAAYKNAVFTEDSKNIAKATVASLRATKKEIDDRRKAVKKAFMRPYDDFESKAKEVMALIDEPIDLISQQVKAFDDARRREKQEKIRKLYEESIGDLAEFLPLEKIYNPKWENATTSMKSVKDEIVGVIQSTGNAIETILAMNSEAVDEALRIFKRTLSMADAINHINAYEKQRAEILLREQRRQREDEERRCREEEQRIRDEERRRIAEEERIREAERRRMEQEMAKAAPKADAEPELLVEPLDALTGLDGDTEDFQPFGADVDAELPFLQPDTVKVVYTVIVTQKEMDDVEMLFNSVGIYFVKEVLS